MACNYIHNHCPIRQFSLPVSQFRPTFPARGLTNLACNNTSRNEFLGIERSRSLRHENSLEIIGSDAELVSRITTLRRPYAPFPFLGNRHVETIFAAFFRSLPLIKYRRECLRMADGGTVALDWPIGGKDAHLWDRDLPLNSPVVILLPGLTGGSDDTYVRHMILQARRSGWHGVVFNSRGCADSPVTSPQFYSASFTEDLRQVVKHISVHFPQSNIYGVGWSLGANILVRYLGQENSDCPLSGAVSLCNPFDLVIADEDFHKGFNNVYDRALARALCKIFKKHERLFEGIQGDYNIPLAAKAKSVRDFDEGLTRVSFGYKSVTDYYYDASSSHSIRYVQTPLLCIQAENDPIAPSRGIPRKDIKDNPKCLLVVTPKGGHLGWVAGDDAPFGAPWTNRVMMEYLEVLENNKMEQSLCRNIDGVHSPRIDCMQT